MSGPVDYDRAAKCAQDWHDDTHPNACLDSVNLANAFLAQQADLASLRKRVDGVAGEMRSRKNLAGLPVLRDWADRLTEGK